MARCTTGTRHRGWQLRLCKRKGFVLISYWKFASQCALWQESRMVHCSEDRDGVIQKQEKGIEE